jgi:DivIVA domain-containing protein
MLTPADINNKQFKATRIREGYDQDEVDNFLDEVSASMVDLVRELKEAKDLIKVLKNQNAQLSNAPTSQLPLVTSASPAGSVEKIITMAQETADKHVADAKGQADQIVREAGGQAAKAIEDATRAADGIKSQAIVEAQQIRSEGVADKQKVLADLENRHGQITIAVANLNAEGSKIREALSEALARYDSVRPS